MVSPSGSSGKGAVMFVESRAYSTEFSAHKALICRMAQKGWGRLQNAGVVMDYDDVFQEMSLIYCKAAAGYDPSKGFTFTAYLGRAIWMDFNKFAEKLINDQCGLGLVRIESIGNDEMDFYDLLPDSAPTPEEACISSRAFIDGMTSLPMIERIAVAKLMRQVTHGDRVKSQSLNDILKELNLNRAAALRARDRIGSAFGVDLKGSK